MVERFARDIQDEKDAAAGVSIDIAAKPGLGELLTNDEENQQFSLYLESLKLKSVLSAFKRYEEGKPTENDEAIIQDRYNEFTERRDRFEKVHKALQVFSDDMLTHSPIFKHFRDLKGTENIRYVIEHGLRDLALTKPTEFAPIEHQVQRLLDQQDEEKKLDEKITKWCEKNHVSSSKELRDAMGKGSEAERVYAIQSIMIKGMSTRQKLWDWVKGIGGGGTYGKASQIGTLDVNALNDERARRSQQAGDYFKNLLVTNKEMRQALARLHTGKEPAFPKGAESLPTLASLKNEAKSFETSSVKQRAEQFRRDHDKAFKRARGNAARIKDLQDLFCAEEDVRLSEFEAQYKKRQGFFAKLMQALFSPYKPEDAAGNAKPEIADILKP